MVFDVLLGEDRGAGGHVADQRQRDRALGDLVLAGVPDQLDRARLAGVTPDDAAPLELVEMVVDGGAG